MTALTVTTEDALLIRPDEPWAMIEDPTCGAGTREVLTRGYFRLFAPSPRARRQRLCHGREVISVAALFCILMMIAMMWMMMGGMSLFHVGSRDSRDTKRDVREHDGNS